MKYLDPKADLTFKKIFGNHPARLISLLNALLPLSEEEQIHEIKYLPTELVPQLEGGKNTIVDVLCTDARGRKFCVEMQMEWSDKRMMVLWLRFLTEINSNTQKIPADLLNDPEIGKAVEELEISGFTDAELRAYDKFWDSVSVERTLLDDRYQKGKEEGIAEGMEKGRAEGMEKGMSQRSLEIARKMLAKGLDDTTIMEMTGLSLDEIRLLTLNL